MDDVLCYHSECKKKGKWVCPQNDCTTAICFKHAEGEKSTLKFIESVKTRPSTYQEEDVSPALNGDEKVKVTGYTSDPTLTDDQVELMYEPSQFSTSAVDPSETNVPIVSNAGVAPVDYTFDNSSKSRGFPTKILLNNYSRFATIKSPHLDTKFTQTFSAKHCC